MLILGIILILVGAAVAYIAPDPVIRFIGVALAIIGLVLVILAVVPGNVGDNHASSASPSRSSWSLIVAPSRSSWS